MGLKDLLFESDKKAAPTKPVFAPPTSAPLTFGAASSAPAFDATVDPALAAQVEQALAAQTPDAYRKFAAILQQLAGAVSNEAERFRAALAMAKLQQLSPQDVGAAYEARLTALGGIETAFGQQQAKAQQERQRTGEAQRAQLGADIERRRGELARLQAELATAEAQLAAAEQGDRQAQERIEDVGRKMAAALQNVRARITAERDAIARNLGGV